MKIIAIHKDSTKYLSAEVKEADIAEFANAALESFRKDLNDPDIHESRIVVVKLDGNPNILAVTALEYINNPPGSKPVVITTHGQ